MTDEYMNLAVIGLSAIIARPSIPTLLIQLMINNSLADTNITSECQGIDVTSKKSYVYAQCYL